MGPEVLSTLGPNARAPEPSVVPPGIRGVSLLPRSRGEIPLVGGGDVAVFSDLIMIHQAT